MVEFHLLSCDFYENALLIVGVFSDLFRKWGALTFFPSLCETSKVHAFIFDQAEFPWVYCLILCLSKRIKYVYFHCFVFFILQRYIVVMNISMWNVIFLICKKYKKSSDFYLHIFNDFFDYSDDFCFVVRRDFYFVKKTIYRFKHEFIVLFDDFFEFWELIVYNKNEVWLIITWLLADQNKVSILDFGLHTVSFCSDKKAVFNITGPNKCYCDRNFFLRIFIDDFFSFVSTLCETIDWKLNDIVVSFSDFFSNKTISAIIFDKITFEYKLIEFIQNGLWMSSSDFICDFP